MISTTSRMPAETPFSRDIHSVSEAAAIVQGLLQDSLPALWVQGEISNFRNPTGHWYFTLKDAGAQLRCAMFKNTNFYVRPQPKDGDQVLIRGKVDFYTTRGELQIIADHMEPAGAGALLRAFEELKKKLAAEGLFDDRLKRAIPEVPRGIGLITSPTGAAMHDILTTLRRRFPLGTVYLYPVPVQGEAAAPAIIQALRQLPARAPVDVLILARGGGSIEDLWCFNDERIARAIRASAVPVVTGIGHEIDFTIADLAADLRAPTPTAAAELCSPDQAEWRERLAQFDVQLASGAARGSQRRAEHLRRLHARLELTHPGRRLQQNEQRLDELWERLLRARATEGAGRALSLLHLGKRLSAASPMQRLPALKRQLAAQGDLLRIHLRRQAGELRARLLRSESVLASLSPLAILGRGYAVARTQEGRVITDAAMLNPGARFDVTLARGSVTADVVAVQRQISETGK